MDVNTETRADDIAAKARFLCDDATGFFDHSYAEMHSIARGELAELQLQGLRYRFDTLKDGILTLRKMAQMKGIERIEHLDDAAPLLFEHTMYKSYPPSLLADGRFADINRWLSRLTTFDLTKIDVSGCTSIDEWMEVMDRDSPLKIAHSSGTSGTMSFLPTSKHEWDKFGIAQKIDMQASGAPVEEDLGEIYGVYPYFRQGASAHIRIMDNIVKFITGREDRLFTAYLGRMSSDVLYLAGRIRAAQERGDLDQLVIPPALLAKKAEYEKLQADMPELMLKFFAEAVEHLKGKRVFIAATWNLLRAMASDGLSKGLEGVFAPNSVVMTGGGAKGLEFPEDWQVDVCRFLGIERLGVHYGMTELHGVNTGCGQTEHYHVPPWIIPFLLDPESGEALPRSGKVTGKAAYFDLSAETRWGGIVTGDRITIDWDAVCPCGRTSHFIQGPIQRFSELQGGDDKISCAATDNAHKEAISFLTQP